MRAVVLVLIVLIRLPQGSGSNRKWLACTMSLWKLVFFLCPVVSNQGASAWWWLGHLHRTWRLWCSLRGQPPTSPRWCSSGWTAELLLSLAWGTDGPCQLLINTINYLMMSHWIFQVQNSMNTSKRRIKEFFKQTALNNSRAHQTYCSEKQIVLLSAEWNKNKEKIVCAVKFVRLRSSFSPESSLFKQPIWKPFLRSSDVLYTACVLYSSLHYLKEL